MKEFYLVIRPARIENQSDTLIRWIYVNIFRLTCVELKIRLKNFKGEFTRGSITSDRLYFASVEIDKCYSLTLSTWKYLCHRWSRDQLRPGSFFQRPREEGKREPENVVV